MPFSFTIVKYYFLSMSRSTLCIGLENSRRTHGRPHVAARAFSLLVGARSVMTQKGHPAWPDAPDGRNRLALVAACIRRPRRPHRRYFWYPAICRRPPMIMMFLRKWII